jgi:hypothetical protein
LAVISFFEDFYSVFGGDFFFEFFIFSIFGGDLPERAFYFFPWIRCLPYFLRYFVERLSTQEG